MMDEDEEVMPLGDIPYDTALTEEQLNDIMRVAIEEYEWQRKRQYPPEHYDHDQG